MPIWGGRKPESLRTYAGYTPPRKALEQADVYGIRYDAERAARKPIRLSIGGGITLSKYFPSAARLRMIWEPLEIAAFAELRAEKADKVRAIYCGRLRRYAGEGNAGWRDRCRAG